MNTRKILLCLTLLTPCVAAAEDWPWFLGPRHDGTSKETLNLAWPEDGPEVVWKQRVGTGYSAPSILDGQLVIHHRERDQEKITCRRADNGEEVWNHQYPSSYVDRYNYNNGPRCSPILADGRCYTLGAEGSLRCLNLADGRLLWKRSLQDEFNIPDWFFGMGCSPVLEDGRLFVLVGGQPNAGVVCFDAATGKTLWQSVGRDTWNGQTGSTQTRPYEWTGEEMVVSYASPILASIHGQRHLLCLVRQGLVSLDPQSGRKNFHYWFRPKVHESVNAARPLVIDDRIFLSAAYRLGSAMLQVSADGKSVKEVWTDARSMLAHWSTPIHVDGFIYGFSGRHRNEGELRCIRASDGELIWKESGFNGDLRKFARNRTTGAIIDAETGKEVPPPYFGRGSLIQVGKHFVALGEEGTLAVVKIDSQKYVEERRSGFPEIKYPAWTAPVVSRGKMYLRSEDWLLCLNVTATEPAEKSDRD